MEIEMVHLSLKSYAYFLSYFIYPTSTACWFQLKTHQKNYEVKTRKESKQSKKSTLQNSEGKNTLLASFIASPPHEQKEKNIWNLQPKISGILLLRPFSNHLQVILASTPVHVLEYAFLIITLILSTASTSLFPSFVCKMAH
jgi:hypothetical protein